MRSVCLFLVSALLAAVLAVPATAAHSSPSFRLSGAYDADGCRTVFQRGLDVMEDNAVPAGFDVRLLGSSDVDAMRRMLGVFARAFEEPKTYLDAQPSDTYLAKLLGREHFIAVAATVHGEIAACWPTHPNLGAHDRSSSDQRTMARGLRSNDLCRLDATDRSCLRRRGHLAYDGDDFNALRPGCRAPRFAATPT